MPLPARRNEAKCRIAAKGPPGRGGEVAVGVYSKFALFFGCRERKTLWTL